MLVYIYLNEGISVAWKSARCSWTLRRTLGYAPSVHALPAVVPQGEVPRTDVVEVRLARRVAPLFGVRWAGNPYDRTWVCDFAALTLAEIARGAPLPGPDDPVPGAPPARGIPGDVVSGPPPVASATLNRFGPHTKSALVLTAANRLLRDATSAVTEVCAFHAAQPLSPSLRLAVWAGLVLEVFRGQPALVVAAIQARAVQRSLTARWGEQVAAEESPAEPARSEIDTRIPSASDRAHTPTRFTLVDETITAVNLGDGPSTGSGDERRDDLASAWARRLLRMGSPGSGIIWMEQDPTGHRAVHAHQHVGAMVSPFVAEAFADANTEDTPLPPWPDAEHLDSMSTFTARAHGIALHAALSYLRYLQAPLPRIPDLRTALPDLVHRAGEDLTRRLGADDPVTLLLTGHAATLTLDSILKRDHPADPGELSAAVDAQAEALRRTSHAWRNSKLAPGTATYLLEGGCVLLLTAAERANTILGPQTSQAVERVLARAWRDALQARGVPADPAAALDRLNDAQVFHLMRYAEYVAHRGTPADLRRALRILDTLTQIRDHVARTESAGLVVKHTAARQAHEAACAVAWRLVAAAPPRERTARERAMLTARRHLRAVLENPSTTAVLAAPGNGRSLLWAIDLVGPVLLDQLRSTPETLTGTHLTTVEQLLVAGRAQRADGAPAVGELILDLTAALAEATAPTAGARH